MPKDKQPSVILLDIETSPITAYTWGTYQQNVLKILEPSKIISVAWKELYSEKVHIKSIYDYKSYKPGRIEDKDLIKEVWKVLDTADIVIAHHGDAFDLKKLNARFLYHGLNAPSFYKSIDTKKVASKYFRLDSNSLNNIAGYLGLGSKLSNGGFELWERCIAGDKDAWKLMKEYNVQDVVLLEKVYLKLRPYMTNHPNLNILADKVSVDTCSCPACMSDNVVKRGFAITRTGKKQRYQCQDCGAWSSGKYEKHKTPLNSEDD